MVKPPPKQPRTSVLFVWVTRAKELPANLCTSKEVLFTELFLDSCEKSLTPAFLFNSTKLQLKFKVSFHPKGVKVGISPMRMARAESRFMEKSLPTRTSKSTTQVLEISLWPMLVPIPTARSSLSPWRRRLTSTASIVFLERYYLYFFFLVSPTLSKYPSACVWLFTALEICTHKI